MCPVPENEKLLEENREVSHELTREEQYLLELLRIPDVRNHLRCLEIKFSFPNQFLTLNTQLKNLRKSVVAVEDNPELQQVILILLKIGNYLNQGTNKSNVLSFNMDLLKSVKMAKAVGKHSKSTMMDFLFQTILTKSPEIAKFAEKLEGCIDGRGLELSLIDSSLVEFDKGMGQYETAIEEKEKLLKVDQAEYDNLLPKMEGGEMDEKD